MKFLRYELSIGLRSNWISETGRMGSDPEGSGLCSGWTDFSIEMSFCCFVVDFAFNFVRFG